MPDVVVCGSLNMDIFGYVDRLPQPGETLIGTDLRYAPGGKGANQAVAAARLGADVAFVGARGLDAFGEPATACLREAGVDLRGLRVVPDATGVAMILVDSAGENQIAVLSGANQRVSPPPEGLEAEVWVTQAEVPVQAVEGLLASARRCGGIAIVNPAPAGRLPAELVREFDIAVVNQLELEALAGAHPPAVVVTLGGSGARLLPDGHALAAYPARAVDTTGAGDALVGGLAAGLAEGLDLADAVRLGMAAAAVCVERAGCQPAMPLRADVEARMRAGQQSSGGK
ncbi:MAG: ribokinase [Gaiellales bacterium]